MRPRYLLYVRLGCHLCTDAYARLSAQGIAVQRVNIDREPQLQEQYDSIIPVLYDTDTDQELLYPFDADDIRRFCCP
ncbi:MAG: glutaredoxin family protein [Cardiobacteriaceae bacterium]|nr:glutaredoxin family protein [Cardiobacteriaceae bacterium]